MADEPNWLGFPAGDHWLDISLGRDFYPDVDEIDDLVDEGLVGLAQKALEGFHKPEDKRELADWYNVKARIETKLKHGNYSLALEYSKKSLELWPGNPRYQMVYDEIDAFFKFEEMLQGSEAPRPCEESVKKNESLGLWQVLQYTIRGFTDHLYQSAVNAFFSAYSWLSCPIQKVEESSVTAATPIDYSKIERTLEHKFLDSYCAPGPLRNLEN